jgi:hypothetical protein
LFDELLIAAERALGMLVGADRQRVAVGAGAAVYELCNLVCDNLARRFERTAPQRAAFAVTPRRRSAKAR